MERAVEAPGGVLVLGHVRVGDVEREDVVDDAFVEAPLVFFGIFDPTIYKPSENSDSTDYVLLLKDWMALTFTWIYTTSAPFELQAWYMVLHWLLMSFLTQTSIRYTPYLLVILAAIYLYLKYS